MVDYNFFSKKWIIFLLKNMVVDQHTNRAYGRLRSSVMGSTQKYFYSMLVEASAAAIALGVTTKSEYRKKRHLDPRLPSDPPHFYKDEWQGWPSFLGKDSKSFYPTSAEASAAALAFGVTTKSEYREKRHLDPHTPSFPPHIYNEEWQGWPSFLSKS